MMLEIVGTTEYLILRVAWGLGNDSVEGGSFPKEKKLFFFFSFFSAESKGQPISEIF